MGTMYKMDNVSDQHNQYIAPLAGLLCPCYNLLQTAFGSTLLSISVPRWLSLKPDVDNMFNLQWSIMSTNDADQK